MNCFSFLYNNKKISIHKKEHPRMLVHFLKKSEILKFKLTHQIEKNLNFLKRKNMISKLFLIFDNNSDFHP
jgi:hypothetical protein